MRSPPVTLATSILKVALSIDRVAQILIRQNSGVKQALCVALRQWLFCWAARSPTSYRSRESEHHKQSINTQ